MCQGGVNVAQLITMTKMSEDSIGLAQGWLEEIHHLADHANSAASAELAQATVKLGEVRHLLEAACDQLEKGLVEPSVHVELV
jgi:hypothetical protein